MESDDLGPLEAVSKAVALKASYSDSPKCHSRSSSHDSYFEQRCKLLKGNANADDNKMDSSLDLSEIQVNFDLEENEMKIFSEDEAMISGECSPLQEDNPAIAVTTASTTSSSNKSPSKTRKMSFREKFKRFTSPTPNRKSGLSVTSGSDKDGSSDSGDTPPSDPKNEKNKKMALRDKIVGALSPESLRRNSSSEAKSPKKKKKSSFSPGTSPSNTSQLIKRSMIEDVNNESTKQVNNESKRDSESPAPAIPLSPSINFIDASMTESFESVTANKTTGELTLSFILVKLKSIVIDVGFLGDMKVTENHRFSTTSSNTDDDQLIIDQLVIAQVHHDPIPENRLAEERESKNQG